MKTIWKIGLAGTVLLALACAAAWLYGRPFYHGYKERRFLAQARAFAAKGDARSALLSARQTLAVNPTNVAACLMMADLIGAARLPTEVDWRRRVAELEPTLANRLALISAALRRQPPPYPAAAEAVEAAAGLGSNSVAYHCLAAELALKLKQADQAEAHFLKASQLDPTNAAHQLNVAVLQLASSNATAVAEARVTLDRLGARTNLGAVALNWLVGDALRRSNLVEAVACSQRLVAHPAATMRDQVQHLELLLQARDPALPAFLESLKIRASNQAAEAFEISGWMAAHEQAAAALAWWRSLPVGVQTQPPGPLAIADCLLAMQAWPEAEEFLKEPPWGEMEFLRQALLARVGWQLQEAATADNCWRRAAQAASDRLGAMTALLTLARQWGRTAEQADLLWAIAARFPRERWALRDLDSLYQSTGNTRGLNKVYAAALAYEATNFVLRNNFAASSLLLNQSSAEAHETALALRREHPADPVIATTYAFSLHRLGKTQEGLAALEQLSPDQLRRPSVALYYAVLLAESGRTKEAKTFADLARTGSLLPEEKALLSKLPLPPDP
jgi:hypothetical protein